MVALGAGGRRRRAQPRRPAVARLMRHSGHCRGGIREGSRSSNAPCWWHEAAGPTMAPQAGPRRGLERAERDGSLLGRPTILPSPFSRRHGHRPPSGAAWRRDVDGTAPGTPCGEPEAVRVGVRCGTRGPAPRETQATPDVSRRLRTMYRAGGWKARVLAVRPFPRGLDARWRSPISRHGLAAQEALRPPSSRRAAAGAIMPAPQDENR